MLNRLILLVSLVAVIILLAMMNLTTPTEIGPSGVLVFFLLIYVVMFGVCTGAVAVFRKMTRAKGKMGRKQYFYAAVMAFAPLMMLLIQSFGSVNLLTVALLAVFVAVGCFVINKRL